jgi:hypothetical protein
MLVLMTISHLPTRLTLPLGQPLGFVSAAEGFVLLSGYMAGLVYGQLANKTGPVAMRRAFWRRALKVYACHALTLLFLFSVIAVVGLRIDQPAVKNLMSYYLTDPVSGLISGLLLIYKPPLLDILPMYVLFLLASPWILAYALRRGWPAVMAVSLALWLLSLFGLGRWLHDAAVSLVGLAVPFNETGSFFTLAWQFLWLLGLWMGASRTVATAVPFSFPRWAVLWAVVFAAVCLVWRHWIGQVPFGTNETLNLLFDKWLLAPLRMLDLFALMIVIIRFGPAWVARLPRLRALETLGAASLPVFCAHLVIVLLALALRGDDPHVYPVWTDAVLLAACFLALYGVARIALRLDRPAPPRTDGIKGGRPPPAAA